MAPMTDDNGGRTMLDGILRKAIDPIVNRWGQRLAQAGVAANTITLAGLGLGLIAAALIASGAPGWLALVPLLAGRVADGLDGAVARVTKASDFGGYLDIACDFLVYGAVPLAFVLRDTDANAAAGAFLLCSFYVNGATFLGFAILAAKRGLETRSRGEKSLYYTAGLLEGSETIALFVAFCLWPSAFAPLAWGFGVLCFVTALSRVLLARKIFT